MSFDFSYLPNRQGYLIGAVSTFGRLALFQATKRPMHFLHFREADARVLQALNCICYVLNVILVYLSNTGAYGATNSEMSKKYNTLVTPNGWAFSIWGLIYVAQGIWAVWQALPRNRENPLLRTISFFWWATCAVQIGWSIAFAQDQIPLSMALMLLLFAMLLLLNYELDSARSLPWVKEDDRVFLSIVEWWFWVFPFAVHCSWITIATLANVNIVVVWKDADWGVQVSSAILSLAAAALASVYVATTRHEPVQAGVAAWALFAIVSKLKGEPWPAGVGIAAEGVRGASLLLACAAVALVVGLCILRTVRLIRARGSKGGVVLSHLASPMMP